MKSIIRRTAAILTMALAFAMLLPVCSHADGVYTVYMSGPTATQAGAQNDSQTGTSAGAQTDTQSGSPTGTQTDGQSGSPTAAQTNAQAGAQNPDITMNVGDQLLLNVLSGEENAAAFDVKFKSSSKTVAKVTKAGVLSAVGKGKAVLTVRYADQTVKIKVIVRKKGSSSENSSGSGKTSDVGKMTCTSSSIKTGKVITLNLSKKAVRHDWTWTFTGSAARDARILNGEYQKNKKITFTVWPAGGTLDVIGTDPEGNIIRCSFQVKQTKKWKKRDQFRRDVLAGLTPDMTVAQKLRYFVDYIADHNSYVSGKYFGVMDGEGGDCISYSAAFKLLADAIGVETIIVKNGGARSHYWAQVNLDGVWYNVDAQGYDTSRTKKWFLSSDARHKWYGDTTYHAQFGVWYPFSPAHVCSVNYKKK